MDAADHRSPRWWAEFITKQLPSGPQRSIPKPSTENATLRLRHRRKPHSQRIDLGYDLLTNKVAGFGMPIHVCAGIPRSGSTWLYNAMRLVMQARHAPVYSTWIGDRDRALESEASATLIKIHTRNDQLADEADIILTCHRDPRDIIASMMSMGWIGERYTVEFRLRFCREAHEYWSPRSAIDFAYTEIVEEDEQCLRRIADALGVALDEAEISDIAVALRETPNNRQADAKHDPEFLTHVNHRNDGRDGRWRDQLPPAVIQSILSEHRDWIEGLGYACD